MQKQPRLMPERATDLIAVSDMRSAEAKAMTVSCHPMWDTRLDELRRKVPAGKD